MGLHVLHSASQQGIVRLLSLLESLSQLSSHQMVTLAPLTIRAVSVKHTVR
jgi:hypothetical protein